MDSLTIDDHSKIMLMQQDINYIKNDIVDIKTRLERHCTKNEAQFEELKGLLKSISVEAKEVASDLAEEKAHEVLETKGKEWFADKETERTVKSLQAWLLKTGVTLIILLGGVVAILIYSLVLNNKL